eukprot:c11394_g1_i1.p1 GENE.c11394_g1_i1~~c11394_g1_i1.p1  ORF type:complete len:531 (+),score=12.05 c11394_g1_i1:88-1680(+)
MFITLTVLSILFVLVQANTDVCVASSGTTIEMKFQTQDWGGVTCFDYFDSPGSIGGTSFDSNNCLKYNFEDSMRRSGRQSIEEISSVIQSRFHSLLVKNGVDIPSQQRRRDTTLLPGECEFAGIVYNSSVSTTTSCPWLSTVENCNNITIGNFYFTLDTFLEESLCQLLHDLYLNPTDNCFKHIQATFCTYIDLTAVPLRRIATLTTASSLDVEVVTYPICNNHCDSMFDVCYESIYTSVSATLSEFKQQSFYPKYRDDICGLFNTQCLHDCDCGSVNRVCVKDVLLGDSLSVCMNHCVNAATDCDDDNKVCGTSRTSSFPDHTCACSETFINNPPTHVNPVAETSLQYCSLFNEKKSGEDSCCTSVFEEVNNVFPPVCTVALPKSCRNIFIPMDCMACHPSALQYKGIRTNSRNHTEDVLYVCRSWVDLLWDACSNDKICIPGDRCLSTSDCTKMTDAVGPDGTPFDTQENFESYAVKNNGLKWEIVDDVANPNAVCWKYVYSAAVAVGPYYFISQICFSLFILFLISF